MLFPSTMVTEVGNTSTEGATKENNFYKIQKRLFSKQKNSEVSNRKTFKRSVLAPQASLFDPK